LVARPHAEQLPTIMNRPEHEEEEEEKTCASALDGARSSRTAWTAWRLRLRVPPCGGNTASTVESV